MDFAKGHRFEVLKGCHRSNNPLHMLRGDWIALSTIFNKVDAWQDGVYREHIDRDSLSFKIIPCFARWRFGNKVAFPEPTGIHVNMMPIKLRDRTTIPDFGHEYMQMIDTIMIQQQLLDRDHVSYLTIHEAEVETGWSHRRSGLHIERPGRVVHGGRVIKGGEDGFAELAWGIGCARDAKRDGYPVDGIYMASNVSGTCAVYPLKISSPGEVTDEHGGIDHMRHLLGEPKLLEAGELCWFTDTTPHESLPVPSRVLRSFFRVVVGRISVWYSKHNTPNPTGLAPDAPISDDDKFEAVM